MKGDKIFQHIDFIQLHYKDFQWIKISLQLNYRNSKRQINFDKLHKGFINLYNSTQSIIINELK